MLPNNTESRYNVTVISQMVTNAIVIKIYQNVMPLPPSLLLSLLLITLLLSVDSPRDVKMKSSGDYHLTIIWRLHYNVPMNVTLRRVTK